MKKFLKMMLAVICGVLILRVLGLLIIGIIASSGSKTVPIPSQGLLKVDMSKIALSEQADAVNPFAGGGGAANITPVGIYQAMRAVEMAAEDPAVKGIYLKPDNLSTGIAQLQEFRSALAKFRQSGKPIVAYTENPTTGSYYLASVADKVYMTSSQGGTPTFTGLSTQLIFLGDLLDRLGIKVQLIRHGKYKSAGEMYIRSSASAENLLQNQVFIDALWKSMVGEMAASRGLTPDDINFAIDDLRLCLPQDFVEYGLVDETLTRAQLEDKLAVLSQVEDFKGVKMIPFADYALKKITTNVRSRKKIAVVYANGEIVDGLDKTNVDGDRFASIIEGIRKDSTIKAVVLRVNSPGGSVVASEKIKNELDMLVAEGKPLIASYGNYAASGGYWISNNADKIYSNPTTITGSIGVFGMVPDISKLLSETAHIGVNAVSSNKHGDMFSLTRPFTPEELDFMQRSIEAIYTRFVSLVAEGRDMTPQAVDDIAQGRVWAGSDALGIGLVDEIGTIEDAIAYAAIAGGEPDLKAWNVVEYPAPQTLTDIIVSMTGQNTEDFSVYTKWMDDWKRGKCEFTFASMPYKIEVR